jgi:hypothetical protein
MLRRKLKDKSTSPERDYFSLLTPRKSWCRYLDRDSFVNAIAPVGDLTKIHRAQFAILFRVADTHRRGLVSWDEFTVFQTLLKRPDADYWIAFQYFDVCVGFRLDSCCGYGGTYELAWRAVTIRGLLLSTSSRMCFWLMWSLVLYRLTLIGTFYISLAGLEGC